MPAIAFALAFLGGGTAYGQDRTDVIVEGLKESPVWVSDSVTRRIDDGDRAALVRAVEAMPFPTYLVVAPFLSADDIVSDEDRLALLRDGLGKDGLYIVSDDRGRASTPPPSASSCRCAPTTSRRPPTGTSTARTRRSRSSSTSSRSHAASRGCRAPSAPRSRPARAARCRRRTARDEESSSAGFGFAILGMFLFGTALSATGLERRRRRRLSRGRRHAGSLPAGNTRERAVSVHAKLAREIARKRKPDDRALDLEVAASMALDRKGKPIDDLGALVLAERGREVLKGKERDRCYFDPRHQGWAKPTRWTTGRATIEVPACSKCAKAIAADKVPDSLWDGDRPYWQRETVWARTGIGALRRDMRGALAEDGR